jgi:hypothetical protein
MDNQISAIHTPSNQNSKPFTKWTECLKAIKKLSGENNQNHHDEILARIKTSDQKEYLAFEALCLIREQKRGLNLNWIEIPMLEILSSRSENPPLTAETLSSDARKWIRDEFQDTQTSNDLQEFVKNGRHLWILYGIFETTPNKRLLVECLIEFSECVERCLNIEKSGKRRKKPIEASSAYWIINLLKSKITPKLDLPKPFLETIFAINATSEVSDEVRAQNDSLRKALKATEEDFSSELQAKALLEEQVRDLKVKLEDSSQKLEQIQNELNEERLHAARLSGHNIVAKGEVINNVLAAVRRGVNHRLQNIRGYADREQPNRVEILALVDEIEEQLVQIKDEVNK